MVQKVERAKVLTSPRKIFKPGQSRSAALGGKAGMTLLEILMVVALLAVLAVVAVPRIAAVARVGVQSSVRRFAAMAKYTYDQAVMTGKVHRIRIDLDKQTWTVEATEIGKLPYQAATEEFLPPGLSKYDLDDRGDKKNKSKDPDFAAIKSDVDVKVPRGVTIIAVDSWRIDKKINPATKGEVSIYAFPNGYIDDAVVYLGEIGKEGLQRFKVSISSLTGHIEIETEHDAKETKAKERDS